jgi:hypothetical protein
MRWIRIFGMSLSNLLDARDLPNVVSTSARETARFGTTIGRVELGPETTCGPSEVVDLVDGAEPDVVVLRYPADRVSWPAVFATSSRSVYHADSIVYWERTLTGAIQMPERIRCRVASADDRAVVHDLAHSAFSDYGSHYRANPRFAASDIALGYAEWAVNQVAGPGSDVVIVSDEQGDSAFAAVELAPPRSEITLSGVPAWSRGRGAYRASMAAAEQLSHRHGCGSVAISTQIHNVVVQRVWAGRGYVPIQAFETAHFVRRTPGDAGSPRS